MHPCQASDLDNRAAVLTWDNVLALRTRTLQDTAAQCLQLLLTGSEKHTRAQGRRQGQSE
jgi:hypothetical protein